MQMESTVQLGFTYQMLLSISMSDYLSLTLPDSVVPLISGGKVCVCVRMYVYVYVSA